MIKCLYCGRPIADDQKTAAQQQVCECANGKPSKKKSKGFEYLMPMVDTLNAICIGAKPGNHPVWDGTVISHAKCNSLIRMGLIEKHKGWYFPTRLGTAIQEAFCNTNFSQLAGISDKLEKEL